MPLKKEKAYLVRKDDSSEKVDFLFNPAELTVERTNQFTEVNISRATVLCIPVRKRRCQNHSIRHFF